MTGSFMNVVPVILSGGMGTRLWPISRECFPKPLIKLSDGESLLQKAFKRACSLPGIVEVLTVTNRDTYFLCCEEFQAANIKQVSYSFLLEPFGRNTAAAITAAAFWIERVHGPQTVMLVLPADHLIEQSEIFQILMQNAVNGANAGKIVTFGIKPTTPETGYGYIEYLANAEIVPGVYSVRSFIEKPRRELAEQYLVNGHYLWNSGMFCFTAATILRELRYHADDVVKEVQDCITQSNLISHPNEPIALALVADLFSRVPDISIDYAVLEKSHRVAVVPCDMGWCDMGSWTAMSELTDADVQGNRIFGNALIHDTKNCYIRSSDRMISAVGVENLIIVDTPDALLVANRERSQDVKHIVGQLKVHGHDSYKIHRTVPRPWGSYTVLEEGAYFKVKRLVVKPGGSLSLQKHQHRNEHWIIIAGCARVINGERTLYLEANQSTYIPAGCEHRLINHHDSELVLIEIQWGGYLGEDDIVRLEDKYGREVANERQP
jgi:mannose-1-phosphate guanylyltransferase / mannose-6-phosphate isomerase